MKKTLLALVSAIFLVGATAQEQKLPDVQSQGWSPVAKSETTLISIRRVQFRTPTIFTLELRQDFLGRPSGRNEALILADCSKRHARILADKTYDSSGKMIAENESAKRDTMGPLNPKSALGVIVDTACSIQDNTPVPGQLRT